MGERHAGSGVSRGLRCDRNVRWIEVGAVWPHKNGVGFDLAIPTGMVVSGRIACMPPSDDKTAS